ncbi:hypothetical protein EBGED10_32750 [Bacillus sp. GeD10]|nr:hypothetical protein EBGED10_32750 [Bacillus sp. GeD10]
MLLFLLKAVISMKNNLQFPYRYSQIGSLYLLYRNYTINIFFMLHTLNQA